MDIRLSGHGAFRTQYHVVWIPKYRRRILNPGLAAYLPRVLAKILREMPGVEIDEINVQPDHVHAVMVIPPKYAVSGVVGKMKAKTSSIFRDRYRLFKSIYKEKEGMWSTGYFVSTVGIDEHVIRRYIKYQEDLDSGQMKFDL